MIFLNSSLALRSTAKHTFNSVYIDMIQEAKGLSSKLFFKMWRSSQCTTWKNKYLALPRLCKTTVQLGLHLYCSQPFFKHSFCPVHLPRKRRRRSFISFGCASHFPWCSIQSKHFLDNHNSSFKFWGNPLWHISYTTRLEQYQSPAGITSTRWSILY